MFRSWPVILLCCFVSIQATPFDVSKENIFPSLQQCGHQTSSGEQITQNKANEKEFPWIVYIPLQSRTFNPNANLRCAGVLISKRYLLFAKTCMQFVLSKVQLGRHDTSKEETQNVIEVDVESRVVNENNEIAMIRLAKDVEFSDYIQPICLPWEELKRATVGEPVYTSGWGLPNLEETFSKTKKKIEGQILENGQCSNTFGTVIEDVNLLCLQVKKNSVGLPCDGDEGTPIMYNSKQQWIAEAILTNVFGSLNSPCITENAGSWKINDKVLTWILQNVAV